MSGRCAGLLSRRVIGRITPSADLHPAGGSREADGAVVRIPPLLGVPGAVPRPSCDVPSRQAADSLGKVRRTLRTALVQRYGNALRTALR